jgi:HTH-type transcriptional regulator/antitoxin HigA
MLHKLLEVLPRLGWMVASYLLKVAVDQGLQYKWNPKQSGNSSDASVPDIHGVELVKALIEEHDLRRKDLTDVFGTELVCSQVLLEEQPLTIEHVQKLSKRFTISPLAFFPREYCC